MLAFRLALVAILSAGFSGAPALFAAPAAVAADPIRDPLEKAKTSRAEERTKARSALTGAIDAQIKTAGAAGDLETLKVLTAQKDGFLTAGVLPNLPALKDAVAQYTQSLRKADGQLVGAYEVAIQAYTDGQKLDDAMNLRKERQVLLNGGDAAAADSPEAIALVFERAKGDYLQTVADARKAYVQVITTRSDAATSQGDLSAVQKLRDVKAAAEADQALPAGFNDAAIQSAKTRYGFAVQAANQKLATAYRDAIRGFTRTKNIEKATEVQAEFDATGLNTGAGSGKPAAAGAGPNADTSSKLAKVLPPFLAASGAFAPEKDGIRPAKGCIVSTKMTDFLSKDFIFDVSAVVPKNDEWVVAGIGDGTKEGSLRVVIRNDGGWGRRAFITLGDEWGKHFGDIHAGEAYIIRVERHEGPITVSVGTLTDGKFTPEMSQTVSDPKTAVAGLSEKRAKLFFTGGGLFSQARLATGAAAASADGGAMRGPNAPIRFPVAGGAAPGGAAAAATDEASKGIYPLTSNKLPAGFAATGTFSVTPAGLKPYDTKCFIVTTAEDFLSKDFVMDLNVAVPANAEPIMVGVGDQTDDGSIRLIVRQDGGWGVRVFLASGDRWGKHFGEKTLSPGEYIFRIERHDQAITVSVGTERDGKFDPEMSQTVADPKAAAPKLSDRRAKLFFTGKTSFSKVRLVTGADAGEAPVPPPAAPVNPGKGGRKK